MDVMIVRTLGPGQEVRFDSFCRMFGLWKKPDAP